MKTYQLLFLLALIFCFSACLDDMEKLSPDTDINLMNKADGNAYLNRELAFIEHLASGVTCTNASDWEMTPIGAKACGGPTGYIAYSKTLDKASFLKKVEQYTADQKKFNSKWGLASDCAIVAAPKNMECVDGKIRFNY